MNCNVSAPPPHTHTHALNVMQMQWVFRKKKHAKKEIPNTTNNSCVHCELSWKEHTHSEFVFNTKLKITVFLDMLLCIAVQRY